MKRHMVIGILALILGIFLFLSGHRTANVLSAPLGLLGMAYNPPLEGAYHTEKIKWVGGSHTVCSGICPHIRGSKRMEKVKRGEDSPPLIYFFGHKMSY